MKEEASSVPNMPLPGYISVKEAAKLTGLNEKTIYRYIDEGKLPAIRVASSILVEEEAAQNYERQSVGRPRTTIPIWRIPTGANIQYLTHITVRVRPGQ